MIPALMPTLAERREMQRAMEKAGRSLALSAADPFHEGWENARAMIA
jgi:predicted dehydrogenase